jgi:hypothetical protein
MDFFRKEQKCKIMGDCTMANVRNKKSKSVRLNSARVMPPLYHKIPGEEYSTKDSQVIQWLIRQPELCEFIWDKIKQSGDVFYNSDTQKWQGVDYDD